MSLTPLKSVDKLDCTVPLGIDKASIDVSIQLEKTPHPPSQELHSQFLPTVSQAEQDEAPERKGQSSGGMTGELQATPTHSHHSAKRNLTQSFEDASLATNSSGEWAI